MQWSPAPVDAILAGIAADGVTLVVAGADDDGPALWTRQGTHGWHHDRVRQPGRAPRIDAVARRTSGCATAAPRGAS